MRALRIAGFAVVLLLVGVLGVFLWFRQASLPVHEGVVRVPFLQQAVRIERDEHGIPHVIGASELDAAFGLGYAHAQDRLWQMEMNRRVAAGRLSELLGPAALDADRFLRTLGIRHAAERIYAGMDGEDRMLADAYAAGVNAFLAVRSGPLPVEFLLTRAPRPEPWTAADSIGWSLIMAWDLARYSHTMELRRLALAQRFSLAELNDIHPPYPGGTSPPTADYTEMYRLMGLRQAGVIDIATRLASLVPGLGFGAGDDVGSNNWVAAGSRTVSGRPLLANDPHLGLSTPSLWYFAALTAPGLNVIGATLPGVPGVLLGHNDRVAWSFTNTGADQQDLYIERVNPANGNEYATPDGWAAYTERTETIRVRGGEEVRLLVRETRHGPVLSGLASIDETFAHPRYVLALRWAALEPADTSFAAVRALNKARSAAEVEAALGQFQLVTQSAVYADVDGQIGMVVTGRIPVRRPDNDLAGIAPAPGWDARYDWAGYLPFEQAPRLRDPPGGVIVTANHRIVGDDYPHHLTHDWFLPYRARRIERLLSERARHDATTFKAIQADIRSQAALDLMEMLRDTKPLTEAGRDAIARLLRWDGSMDPQRPEPLVFHAWMRELKHRAFEDDFGPLTAEYVDAMERTPFLLRVLSGRAQARDWCDDRRTGHRVESCAAIAAEALDAAVMRLTSASGSDVAGLRWGDAHLAIGEHRPLSSVGWLSRFVELRTPFPGDTYTVNVGALTHRPDAPFSTRHGPSLRAIYDLAALDRNSSWVLSSGQSGSPFAEHYADMVPLWRDAQYLPMRPAAGSDRRVLELRPK
ncbi:MAG TPA: penicillin acylase family protein [Burkholderiaceae bacterium]|nr:penicillin acylase family protein [Burkholderiaceae bacterium]